MGTEENKMLVRQQFDEIWNGANWATVDELYNYATTIRQPGPRNRPRGIQAACRWVSQRPPASTRIERQVAQVIWSKLIGRCAVPGGRGKRGSTGSPSMWMAASPDCRRQVR
jgi:hypothetical protein